MLKTHHCGELRKAHNGQQVMLAGWVHRRRDQGGLIFIDLRDRWGLTQVVVDQEGAPDAHAIASTVRNEYVVQIKGSVRARPDGTVNPDMPTGEIEVVANEITVLNSAKTPPFYINREENVDEALRMQYRYLDLRRPPMQKNFITRHRVIKFIRDYLDNEGLSRSKPLYYLRRHRKARAISWCRAGCSRENSMHSPKARNNSNSC